MKNDVIERWTATLRLAERHAVKFRFVAAGILNTAFGLAIFPLLMWALAPRGVHYLVVLVISQVLSVTLAFINNKFLVFRSRGNYLAEYGRFAVFYIGYFLVNLAVLPFLVEVLRFNAIVGQTLFSVCVVVTSYFWHSKVTFRPSAEGSVSHAQNYLRRPCPLCAAPPPEVTEVATLPAAESLPFDALAPHWNGLFKRKMFFSYARCPKCRLLYAPIFFTEDQLTALYAQMPPNMDLVPTDALRRTQRGYFEVLKAQGVLEGGYIEIGPDTGLFVAHCVSEARFDPYWLFEPNRAVAGALGEAMAGKRFRILHQMADFSAAPAASAGAVVMIQVLDHLLDPAATLRQLRDKLDRKGHLVIVTHNESSVLRRIFGARWPAFCLQHPQIYSRRSMRALVEAAGYELVTIRRTTNFFPIQFLLRNLLWACGLKVRDLPKFGGRSVGLKLGNMITVARPLPAPAT